MLVLLCRVFEYLREPLYAHALEHLKADRPEKKIVQLFSSYGKCLTIRDPLESLRLVGTHVRRERQS